MVTLKRIVVTILALLYLCTATGTTFSLHYCMGKFTGYSFRESHSKKCSKCGMVKKSGWDNGCCKDEQKQLKLDDYHKLAENYFSWNLLSPIALILTFFPDYDSRIIPVSEQYPVSNAPPLRSNLPAYLRFCVFRI